MKNEVDSHFILKVFEKIRQHGNKQEDGYHLGGVKASTDFDGYTVYIEDALVKLSFGFHNQYHYDYAQTEHAEAFERKLKAIDNEY